MAFREPGGDFFLVLSGRDDASRNRNTSVFGYWFSTGLFDHQWSIKQLLKLAEVAPKAEPDSMIMEQLAEICAVDPVRSAQIVGLFVEGDDDGWRVGSWKTEALAILGKSMQAGDEAKSIAEGVIDKLGRLGHLEFGKLLDLPD